MNEAIKRAKEPNASALSIILQGNVPNTEVPNSLSNPADSALYFDALLRDHVTLSSGGILGLLALCASYFIGEIEDGLVTNESALLYLRAVSLHSDIISEYWHSSTNITSNARCIVDILKAVSSCTSFCCSGPNRYTVLSTGILPALAKISTGKPLTDILHLHYSPTNTIKTDDSPNNNNTPVSSPPTKKTNTTGKNDGDFSLGDSLSASAESNQPDPFKHNILTPAHATFLQCCILSSQYQLASKFAKHYPVYLLSKNQSSHSLPNLQTITTETYLTYFYYLGMVHIGNNDYRAAISAFHICLTTPAKDISAVVIAAHKKSLLARCCLTADDLEDEELFDQSMAGINDTSNIHQKHITSTIEPSQQSIQSKQALNQPGNGKSESFSKTETNMDAPNGTLKPLPLTCKVAYRILKVPDFVCNEVNRFLDDASRSKHRKDFNKQFDSNDFSDVDPSMKTVGVLDRDQFGKNYSGLPHYKDLVAAFCSFNVALFETYLDRDKLLLEADGNLGLAKRLVGVMKRIIVRKIAKVYRVIRLKTLAESLQIHGGAKEARKMLLQIAWKQQEKEIHGGLVNNLMSVPFKFRIDMVNEIVYFPKDHEESDDSQSDECFNDANVEHIQSLLTNRVISMMELADRVKNLDISLVTSARFQTLFSKDLDKSGNASDSGISGPCGVTDLA